MASMDEDTFWAHLTQAKAVCVPRLGGPESRLAVRSSGATLILNASCMLLYPNPQRRDERDQAIQQAAQESAATGRLFKADDGGVVVVRNYHGQPELPQKTVANAILRVYDYNLIIEVRACRTPCLSTSQRLTNPGSKFPGPPLKPFSLTAFLLPLFPVIFFRALTTVSW